MFPPESLAQLMRDQHGVVSRSQARRLGLTDRQIDRRISGGEWIATHRGVYRHHIAPAGWHARVLAACLAFDALASHRAAARLHAVDGVTTPIVEVSVGHGRFRDPEGVHLHQSTQMRLAEPTTIDAIPVTGLARTVLDFAAVSSLIRTNGVIDSLIRSKRLGLDDLVHVLARHSRKGRDGCGRLRAVLDERVGEIGVPRSDWSRHVARLLVDHGLPKPEFEYPVTTRGGVVLAEVDLAYPAEGVAIELESVRWHLNRESFERDPARRNQVVNAGWTPLAFTYQQYYERPIVLVATVRDALRRAHPAVLDGVDHR
ncbi:MAG: type IV toxin-antitoxin system AbiEi family antitoxin domain-containing protein [Acidimicrobiales bacterium]